MLLKSTELQPKKKSTQIYHSTPNYHHNFIVIQLAQYPPWMLWHKTVDCASMGARGLGPGRRTASQQTHPFIEEVEPTRRPLPHLACCLVGASDLT
jgi:hypothetical protein